jgi:CRP-like cAMP-binding protein
VLLTPAETVKIFKKQSNTRHVPAGTVIFNRGEVGDEMYGILEGEVTLSINGKVLETIKAGDVFGEGALLHQDGSRYTTATASTDCTLVCMNQEHFLFAIQETPMFALEVMRSYSDRLRHLKDLLI